MEEITLPPYKRGTAKAPTLQATIDELLAELPPEDAAALERVTVKEGEQDIDPLLTPILITIVSKVGADIAVEAWHRLKARIEARLGEGAIGEQEVAADEHKEDT